MRLPIWFWTVGLGLVLALPAAGRAGPYTFTPIADNVDRTFFFTDGAPVISSDGRVFFTGAHAGLSAIFQGNGSSPATPYLAASSGLNEFNQLAVNSQGTVAFEAFRSSDGRRGIFTYDGSNLTTIAVIRDPSTNFFFVGSPQINNAGTVAFNASLNAQGTSRAVYTGNGGPLTQIATSNPPLSSFFFAPLPSINNDGLVAFNSSLDGGGSGIFTGTGGPLTQLYGTDGFLRTLNIPDLNDAGQVVFQAGTASGEGIFVGNVNGGPLTTVADTSQNFRFFFGGPGPSINNNGEVAFAAELRNGFGGIFTGADPVSDKVIMLGDELFGGHVVGFGWGRGLNDNGQITFRADVQAPTGIINEYIVRADPAPVPEPSTLTLFGLGVLGLANSAWRRKRAC